MIIAQKFEGNILEGTYKCSSNYRKFELRGSNYGGLFIRNCMENSKGPEQVVRIVESSNYGGSNYGGSTVLCIYIVKLKTN